MNLTQKWRFIFFFYINAVHMLYWSEIQVWTKCGGGVGGGGVNPVDVLLITVHNDNNMQIITAMHLVLTTFSG